MLFGEKQIHSCMHFSVWFATPSPAKRHEEILTAYSPGGLLLAGGLPEGRRRDLNEAEWAAAQAFTDALERERRRANPA